MMRLFHRYAFAFGLVLAALIGIEPAKAVVSYEPQVLSQTALAPIQDLLVADKTKNRDIPVRIFMPKVATKAPVILFSHGLGGSRFGNDYLGRHWAQHGYVVVFLQHKGSDESVWKAVPRSQRMAALKRAANYENFMHRVHDVSAVLDQLTLWSKASNHPLFNRLDLSKIGMAGHSFGAVTTQAVTGQRFGAAKQVLTDNRLKAGLMLSPSQPSRKSDMSFAFENITMPWMLMTGTHDNAAIGSSNAEDRRAVYQALPKGSKYELVLDGAEHSAFSESTLPADKNPRNPNHHRAILALSTAFWDSYLKGDQSARLWLDGTEVVSVLEPKDIWQRK
jgi:predicted dienelactone hydrolase